MKKVFCIIAIALSFVSCTSSISEPKNKKEYLDNAREFYNEVEENIGTIDNELWSDYKKRNDKIVGENFLRFKAELTAREIVFIGKQNYKFQKHYSDYKQTYKLIDESLKNGGDSIKIAKKITAYQKNGQEDELDKYIQEAINMGGKAKNYTKAILFELEIDEKYSYLWE